MGIINRLKNYYLTFGQTDHDWYIMNKNTLNDEFRLEKNWIATVTLQTSISDNPPSEDTRLEELFLIVGKIAENTMGDGIIVFPAGWFSNEKNTAHSILPKIEQQIKYFLSQHSRTIIVVFGIDGDRDNNGNDRDQIVVAFSKTEMVAAARKFNPTQEDLEFGLVPAEVTDLELGKHRIFSLNGINYFLAVCNDVSGGHNKNINKKTLDFHCILNPVHKFEKGDGITDWVRKKVGLESKYWGCPIFGSVKFINGYEIQESWKPGVFWSFKENINTRTKGTTVDKITVPCYGDPITIENLSAGEKARVHIFRDFASWFDIMKEKAHIDGDSPISEKTSEQKHKSLSLKPKQNIIPKNKFRERFENLLHEYNIIRPNDVEIKYTSSKTNCRIIPPSLPKEFEYQFCDWGTRISVELIHNRSRLPHLEHKLIALSKKRYLDLPTPNVKDQGAWLRLQFFFDENTQPGVIADAMNNLIGQTYPEIR